MGHPASGCRRGRTHAADSPLPPRQPARTRPGQPTGRPAVRPSTVPAQRTRSWEGRGKARQVLVSGAWRIGFAGPRSLLLPPMIRCPAGNMGGASGGTLPRYQAHSAPLQMPSLGFQRPRTGVHFVAGCAGGDGPSQGSCPPPPVVYKHLAAVPRDSTFPLQPVQPLQSRGLRAENSSAWILASSDPARFFGPCHKGGQASVGNSSQASPAAKSNGGRRGAGRSPWSPHEPDFSDKKEQHHA